MNFFKKVKTAIFKFDEYEKFIVEKPQKAIGYFVKLMIIFAVIVAITIMYCLNGYINELKKVIENEVPQFKISNNTLDIEQDKFEHYFEDFNYNITIDKSSDIAKLDYENYLLMLKDKVVIGVMGYSQEITYRNLLEGEELSKDIVLKYMQEQNWTYIYLEVFSIVFIYAFIILSILMLLDVLILSILALIINKLIHTKFRYADLFKISIYSMTLPIILYIIYSECNLIFGTTIEYFKIAYDAISYIYLITVMLMLKADIIKNMQELQSVLEEQKKVREELKKEKEEQKEKEQEEKNNDEEKQPEPEEKNKDKKEPQTDNG